VLSASEINDSARAIMRGMHNATNGTPDMDRGMIEIIIDDGCPLHVKVHAHKDGKVIVELRSIFKEFKGQGYTLNWPSPVNQANQFPGQQFGTNLASQPVQQSQFPQGFGQL